MHLHSTVAAVTPTHSSKLPRSYPLTPAVMATSPYFFVCSTPATSFVSRWCPPPHLRTSTPVCRPPSHIPLRGAQQPHCRFGGLSPLHLLRVLTGRLSNGVRQLRAKRAGGGTGDGSPTGTQKKPKKKQSSSRFDDDNGEWIRLVEDFEQRTNARYGQAGGRDEVASVAETIIRRNRLVANSPRQKHLNPEQFKFLRNVESGSMAAVTIVLWYLGRVFRMDPFLLLFYPLPTLYIASRWGLEDADRTLFVILFLSFVLQGPFFTKSYFMSSGILTMTYARTLWYRAPWHVSLLCGAAAKGVGVVLGMCWYSLILGQNTWTLVTGQIADLINGILKRIVAFGWIQTMPVVAIEYVRAGVLFFVIVHSIYHVFCTFVFTSLILLKVSERAELARVPKDLPILKRLLRLQHVQRFEEL